MDEQAMAYQGEDIHFTIMGGDAIDLDSSDFIFLTYPCSDPSKFFSVMKATCQKVQTNVYVAKIPQMYTMTAIPGPYAIEIFDRTGKAIYQKRNAYIINTSAAKIIISEG